MFSLFKDKCKTCGTTRVPPNVSGTEYQPPPCTTKTTLLYPLNLCVRVQGLKYDILIILYDTTKHSTYLNLYLIWMFLYFILDLLVLQIFQTSPHLSLSHNHNQSIFPCIDFSTLYAFPSLLTWTAQISRGGAEGGTLDIALDSSSPSCRVAPQHITG